MTLVSPDSAGGLRFYGAGAALDSPEAAVHRYGRSSTSPFLTGAGLTVVRVVGDGVVGYIRKRRWAIAPAEPATPDGLLEAGIAGFIAHTAHHRLRPVVAAVGDPRPYVRRGLFAHRVAEDPMIDLKEFSLDGKSRAGVRHSVASARRCGLRVEHWSACYAGQVEKVSAEWLSTKRGGEYGFTLGRFDPHDSLDRDYRIALTSDDRVVGLVSWLQYDNGSSRVLDLMRRAHDAPNPTMDLLISDSLLDFARQGLVSASLGAVPHDLGHLAEHVYPAKSLRSYKDKFVPDWQERYLIAPSKLLLPHALAAVAGAYCDSGLRGLLRRNG